LVVKLALIGAAGLLLTAGAALAQARDGAAPPAQPEVKMVGDWMVRCFAAESPNPCDVFQEQDSTNGRQRILSVSIAYVPSMDRHLMQITVPLQVSLPKGITIQADNYTSPVLKYRMCTREGCFVQTAIDSALIESLAKSGSDAKINVAGEDGKSYALRLSLKGFSTAHDSMVSQAKAKAKSASAGGASTPKQP
jgi:invasion protein IalB